MTIHLREETSRYAAELRYECDTLAGFFRTLHRAYDGLKSDEDETKVVHEG